MWAKTAELMGRCVRSTSVAVLQRHFVGRYITVAKRGYIIVSNKVNEQNNNVQGHFQITVVHLLYFPMVSL